MAQARTNQTQQDKNATSSFWDLEEQVGRELASSRVGRCKIAPPPPRALPPIG